MPLFPGSSQSVISENIREMRNAGHPENVAVAAALHNADKGKGKKKGKKAKAKAQKPLSFKKGGLHESTDTKAGQKISAKKHAEAKSGKLGPKAKKQEQFYENVLS